MSGSVYDIDFYVFVMNGSIFRHDSDTAFTFDSIGVHNSVFNYLIFTVDTALFKHLIYKRCFTVVNVCNDCNISQIFSYQRNYLAFL